MNLMDELGKEELDQLMSMFRDQSLQILEEMGQDLLALESGTADSDAMTRLRRGAHTIKGDSACVGLGSVTEVAHKIEDVLDAVVEGRILLDRPAVDVILKGLDAVRAAVTTPEAGDVSIETAGELLQELAQIQNDSELLQELARIQDSSESDCSPASAAIGAREVADKAGNQTEVEARRRSDYVRVEAAKIDTLLNLAGEMVIARSVINQLSPELEAALPKKNDIVTRFGSASLQMGKLIAELQKSALKMRMVTVDHVFRRFSRPMRQLAGELGKEVELDISGGETELDRALVDLLYEPLLHLLRNAIDHGLETGEERLAAGKPGTGRIAMRAYHEGNQVVIEVSDDGRGINAAALKARAIDAGAITRQQADLMPENDALNLLFLEGVSTATRITQLSGRGVGGAAVKCAVEGSRGSVSLKSEMGSGTCFTLRTPHTLAINRALLFKAAGQLFALPLLAVSEIARAEGHEIVHLDGMENYRLRDRFISLVRPGAVLSVDRRKGGSGAALRSEARHFFILILAAGDKRYGVVADELIGEQELVIKPLDGHWLQSEALAGASVLGDGRVVLIMDAEMVFRKAIKYERAKGNDRQAYAV